MRRNGQLEVLLACFPSGFRCFYPRAEGTHFRIRTLKGRGFPLLRSQDSETSSMPDSLPGNFLLPC